jgi:hypothetical protein
VSEIEWDGDIPDDIEKHSHAITELVDEYMKENGIEEPQTVLLLRLSPDQASPNMTLLASGFEHPGQVVNVLLSSVSQVMQDQGGSARVVVMPTGSDPTAFQGLESLFQPTDDDTDDDTPTYRR